MMWRESDTVHMAAREEVFWVAGIKASTFYQVASCPFSCLLVT